MPAGVERRRVLVQASRAAAKRAWGKVVLGMAIDFINPVLLLIGAFYAFAGVVAVRAVLSMRFIDVAIAAIGSEKPDRRETLQQVWLLVASLVIFAGGIALLLRTELAAALFTASAMLQIFYLAVAAPYYFDAAEAPDAKGRAGTTNAAVLYVAATAFVVWAYARCHLVPLDRLPPALVAAAALVVIGLAVYAAWTFVRGMWLSGGGARSQSNSGDEG